MLDHPEFKHGIWRSSSAFSACTCSRTPTHLLRGAALLKIVGDEDSAAGLLCSRPSVGSDYASTFLVHSAMSFEGPPHSTYSSPE